ncbi:MMPL family transporter, partial [Bacteroidales bacterium OttesenSCG-928-C19]|nr:MMPL family transporter [Bacteroidales bacterium OttesenSCG-928-C19]
KYVNDPEIVLKDQTVPVVLGSLTTIGAFMGLMLTKSELLQDFGLFASLGLVGTTIFCLLFLPQFFNPKNNRKSDKAFAILERINSFPLEKQKWLIVLILVICGVCFVASRNVKFDSDLRNIGYDDARVVKSRNLLASKTTGDYSTVYFSSVAEDLDSALIFNQQLCERLEKQVENGNVKSYSAQGILFIPIGKQQERIDHWNAYWTQEKKEILKKNILKSAEKYKFMPSTFVPFFNILDEEYEPVSLYEAEIIPDELLENIIEYTDGKYLVFTPVQMDKSHLMDVSDQVVADDPNLIVIDPMYYTNDMVKMMHKDFNTTLTISSLFVLLVLLISYRSIILALIAFLPMGLSWYIVLGFMSIFGMEFNLINIVISAFIFGVGVDYSIFIMDGLLTTYRTRRPTLMYHKTAIFFSAVILIIVVASLLFAVHPAIASIGPATLVGMISTILIAYSLQPFLYSLLITNRVEKGKAPFSIVGLFYPTKSGNPKSLLINNYMYKGNRVESGLYSELRKTNNYLLINEMIERSHSLLDYGCGYGFSSYNAMLNNNQLQVTGFDSDEEAIVIANNCYQKNERIHFSTNPEVFDNSFDTIILNKEIEENLIDIKTLFSRTKIVIVRKNLFHKYDDLLKELHFNEEDTDAVFVAYVR